MQIDDKTWVVDSLMAFKAFCAWVWEQWQEHKYLTFAMRIGKDRSLDQNALLHVWLTLYAAHLLHTDRRHVSEPVLEGIKSKAKRKYYADTGAEWMLIAPVDPWTGTEEKRVLRSTANYKTGEMFLFLTWLQNTAANDGLVLESKGQYAKLQREQAA